MSQDSPGQRSPREDRGRRRDIPGLANASEATIYPHIFANADREVGGVLVGRAPRGGALPLITGAIAALSADEQRATLTFTQDAWEHVHRTLDREFPPEDTIVGWYHSHPSFGIFLSEHDLFIHRNFFNGPAQIALVIDPINCTEGVFAWRDGDIVQLFERPTPRHWQARSNRGELAPVRRVTVERPPPAPDTGALLAAFVIAAVIGIAFGFGVWHVALHPVRTVTQQLAAPSRHRQARRARTVSLSSAPRPAADEGVKRTDG